MKQIEGKAFISIVALGIFGAASDAFLNLVIESDHPFQLLGWLLPAAAAIGMIVAELAGIRQAIQSSNKEKHQ